VFTLSGLIRRIDSVLPQTQCRRCGYAGCLPYAEAIARERAPINRCPPGGEEVIRELASLTHRAVLPLDPRLGPVPRPAVAYIDEARCIGCTLCIQACPVDAIVGAAKLMHTVVSDACTGCELCLAPCPVDCILMRPTATLPDRRQAADWRERFHSHTQRLARDAAEKAARPDASGTGIASQPEPGIASPSREAISSAVVAAMERARMRRAASGAADVKAKLK